MERLTDKDDRGRRSYAGALRKLIRRNRRFDSLKVRSDILTVN